MREGGNSTASGDGGCFAGQVKSYVGIPCIGRRRHVRVSVSRERSERRRLIAEVGRERVEIDRRSSVQSSNRWTEAQDLRTVGNSIVFESLG